MKRAVVFVNGEAGKLHKLIPQIREHELILCADGGAVHCFNYGMVPHVIIGDLDSLSQSPEILQHFRSLKVSFLKYPSNKDYSDLELTLDYALEQKVTTLLLLCPFGGRLDHLLGNVFLASLEKYSSMSIEFSDGYQSAFLLRGAEERTLSGKIGSTFSLIPLSSEVHGVNLSGATWPLKDATLNFGKTLSLSNSFAKTNLQISIKEGLMLLVWETP
ncbi:MAG: thiamine diphosphokinase [SAR324 cluster bacterium]|uniref:Thiamine diphosphokinase n=1 Tax=SAR324 cluster bacterium TaxID=2024889 RepID=A0A7X9FS02_9DELT|nr:thiamine diphosphokinase [SAR324 cluster bacterium]